MENDVAQLAPAAVPFLLYLIKLFFKYVIPDSLVTEVRDEVIPALAPVIGIVANTALTGQVDWTAGATAGLAGVGLHQVAKQFGVVGKRGN